MKRLLITLLLFYATAAHAQTLPGSHVIDNDGLGTNGTATVSGWFINGQAHVFLWTGSDPESYGTFTLTLPFALLGPNASNNGIAHPICSATASWTNNDYASGYANPRWPPVFLWQDTYNLQKFTITFGWSVWGQTLQPHAGYSVNIICPPKITGFGGTP